MCINIFLSCIFPAFNYEKFQTYRKVEKLLQ